MNTIKPILFSAILLLMQTISFAQAPQKFNYQGIARDSKGNPLRNQNLRLKISILQAADATTAEYEEIHSVSSNEFGLYALQIGTGTSLKNEMKNVDWAKGNKYIKVSIDPEGGNNFSEAGVSQLLSVPYALYADRSGIAGDSGHMGTRTGNVTSNVTHVAGDVNYLSKFTALNTIGKSQIFDNGTNIGVGTNAPAWAFHLKKATATYLTVQADADNSTAAIRLQDNGGTGGELNISKMGNNIAGTFMGLQRKNAAIFNNISGALLFNPGSYTLFGQTVGAGQIVRMMIDSASGYVGINTTIANPPTRHLDINGQLRIRGGSPASGKILTSDVDGNASWEFPAPDGKWAINGTHIYNSNTGNVGIGTNAPVTALHIKKPTATYVTVQTDADNSTAAIRIQDNSGTGNELAFSKFGANTPGTFMGISRNRMAVINNLVGPIVFNAGGYCVFGQTSGPNQRARMIIDSATGRIGIGNNLVDFPPLLGRLDVRDALNNPILANFMNTTDTGKKTVSIRMANGNTIPKAWLQSVGGDSNLLNINTGEFYIEQEGMGARLLIDTLGNVGIGTTTPGGLLELALDEGRKPASSTWTITSDERLKHIDGEYTKGLSEILQLRPIMYHYKNTRDRQFPESVLSTQAIGFSAQEIQKIFPECVGTDPDGYLNLNTHAVLIAYVNAIKELNEKQNQQQQQMSTLQEQLIILKKQNDLLLKRLEGAEGK